jgi:hypothetical protein
MSQFDLTPEEDQLIIDALKAKGAQYAAMFGSSDPACDALIEKLSAQLPVDEVVEEAAPAAVVEPEVVVETPQDVVEVEEIAEAHLAAEEAAQAQTEQE